MSAVLRALAGADPQAVALYGADCSVSYGALADSIRHAADHFLEDQPQVVGLAMDNGPAWAVIDLAALQASIPIVPLPAFFSPEQLVHAIADAGIDCLHTDRPELFERLLAEAGVPVQSRTECRIHAQAVTEFRLQQVHRVALPHGTAKITYTSGTTGNPKGVCLSLQSMERVAQSLLEATAARPDDRHVSVLPLSTLLENIAGLYVPLLAGAATTLLPAAAVGFGGATGLDPLRMAEVLSTHLTSTTVLTPELLRAWIAAIEAGLPLSGALRFVAVGGAPVAEEMVWRARELGIPVFEGYGLSECASVVAVNTPIADRIGSVGHPLPHVRVAFAGDGEILVAGTGMLGYAGEDVATGPDEFWPTGDLGFLDVEGFLHITGRKKNIFITSFGRNVAPEWVERELTLHPAIAQAAVFGESRPWNVAVIVPRENRPESAAEIEAAILDANARLPQYARVRRWLPAAAPFTPANGQSTANGRLRRPAILAVHQSQIDALYEEELDVVL